MFIHTPRFSVPYTCRTQDCLKTETYYYFSTTHHLQPRLHFSPTRQERCAVVSTKHRSALLRCDTVALLEHKWRMPSVLADFARIFLQINKERDAGLTGCVCCCCCYAKCLQTTDRGADGMELVYGCCFVFMHSSRVVVITNVFQRENCF